MSRPAEIVGGSISSLLPIKCFLNSQSYAPFIINMLLPPVVVALAALVLVPTTFVEHALRAHRDDAGVEAPAFKGKFNIPDFLACWRVLRQPMTEGDVAAWRAPFVWTGRLAGVAVFALFFLYPTLVASIASIFNCSAPVSGKRYLLADLTVVCNEGGHIALIFFACIGGAVYAIGIPVAVVIATALKTPLVCHGAANAETGIRPWARPRCVCARRDQAKYAAADVRTRFGFLYHGYATDRSGAIVAWEALVMLRKLAITLVGSAVSDVRSMRTTCRCCPARGGIRVPLSARSSAFRSPPSSLRRIPAFRGTPPHQPYLQILWALLILVASFGATAFFAPYEIDFLNALDVAGLFALIVTQIFSIVYFYAETAKRPFMDKGTLEVLVTLTLFLVNIAVILVFFVAFVSEALGLREKLRQRGKRIVRIVAEHDAGREADIAGAEDGYWWHHPSGVAVRTPPVELHDADGTPCDAWVWHGEDGGIVSSTGLPELLQDVDGLAALEVEEEYRWMHPTTHRVSAPATRYRDVGGCLCCWEREKEEEDAPHAAGAAAVAPAVGEGITVGPGLGGRIEVLNPVSDALAALDPAARAAPRTHVAEDAAAPTPSPGAAAVKNALQRGIDASVRTIETRVARKKVLKAHAAHAASVRDDENVSGIGMTERIHVL